jgi:hypothetical protein
MVPSGSSANLPLPDYGRVARHLGAILKAADFTIPKDCWYHYCDTKFSFFTETR